MRPCVRRAWKCPVASPEAATTEQQPPGRVLYRIVRDLIALPTDFRSNLVRCLPMRFAEPKDPLLWAGLSMYDTPQQAARTARKYNGKLGAFLAELYLPSDSDRYALVRQSLVVGHFTVLCCDRTCLSFVRDVQPIVGLST